MVLKSKNIFAIVKVRNEYFVLKTDFDQKYVNLGILFAMHTSYKLQVRKSVPLNMIVLYIHICICLKSLPFFILRTKPDHFLAFVEVFAAHIEAEWELSARLTGQADEVVLGVIEDRLRGVD